MPNDDLNTQQRLLRMHALVTEDLKRADALAQKLGFENIAALVMDMKACGKDLGFKNIRSFAKALREEKHVKIVALATVGKTIGQKNPLTRVRALANLALYWEGMLEIQKIAEPHALKVVGGKK